MNLSQLKHTIILLYIIIALIGILGLISSDIYLFIASTALFILTIPIQINNPKVFQRDKKLRIGSQEALKQSFHISNILFLYIGLLIITFRESYPQYSLIGYTLIFIVFIEYLIYLIFQKNIENKYLK